MHVRVHVLGDAADPEGLELCKERPRPVCSALPGDVQHHLGWDSAEGLY